MSILSLGKSFFYELGKLIAPPFCAACKQFLDQRLVLCEICIKKIQPIVSHELALTKTKSVRVCAVGSYKAPLQQLILAKSHGNRTVSAQLGELVWQMSAVQNLAFDVVVPIPLHWSRYAWRGYNQADEIARVIAKKSNRPKADLLYRVRRTPYQSMVDYNARSYNVASVFALTKHAHQYKGKQILLVDDVMTSGATLKEASKILYTMKPASITAVVVARTV